LIRKDEPDSSIFQAYANLENLVEKSETDPNTKIKQAFTRGGKLLSDSKLKGKILFRAKEGDKTEYFSYEFDERRGIFGTGPLDKPDLEIFVEKETLLRIIEGNLSPIEAIGTKRMRVRGNIKLALKLYRTLAVPEGKITPCREEEES